MHKQSARKEVSDSQKPLPSNQLMWNLHSIKLWLVTRLYPYLEIYNKIGRKLEAEMQASLDGDKLILEANKKEDPKKEKSGCC